MTTRCGGGVISTPRARRCSFKARSAVWTASGGRVATEEVAWARHGARHTRLFDEVVAWWCQRADRTTVVRFWRANWVTVTAIAARVVAERLDESRFDGLTRIGVDEIS